MTLRQDEKDWNAGYAAGRAGEPDEPPPRVRDRSAWTSGYLKGKADREEARRPLKPSWRA